MRFGTYISQPPNYGKIQPHQSACVGEGVRFYSLFYTYIRVYNTYVCSALYVSQWETSAVYFCQSFICNKFYNDFEWQDEVIFSWREVKKKVARGCCAWQHWRNGGASNMHNHI